jgi:hypothetical protein
MFQNDARQGASSSFRIIELANGICTPHSGVSECQQVSSPTSVSISSTSSIIEPSVSAEPVVGISASTEGSKSSDRKIQEIEENDLRHGMTTASQDAVNRTDIPASVSPHNRPESSQSKCRPLEKDRQYAKATKQPPEALNTSGPPNILSCAQVGPNLCLALKPLEEAFPQPSMMVEHSVSFIATTTVRKHGSIGSPALLSLTVPSTVMDQPPNN